MYLKQIEERIKDIPFCATPRSEDAHFNIRRPLMQMFGLELKKSYKSEDGRWQPNGYAAKHMIPTNKSASIWQLKVGVDARVNTHDDKVVKISAEDVKKRQSKIDLVYDKSHISAEEVYHIQLIKAGKRVAVPSQYKDFISYKKNLEKKASYVVMRAEVTQYLDHLGKLLNDPIESVVHYTTFPKLVEGSLDYKYFVKNAQLIESKKPELTNKFKSIIKLNALMAAKHKEGLSLVVPNAFFSDLDKKNKKEAKELFVDTAIEVANEIKGDYKYSGFRGIFVSTGGDKVLNKRINESGIKSIAVNHGDLSAPSRALEETIGKRFAETIMGEGLGYVGNGALSARGNHAVEENLIEHKIKDKIYLSIKCKTFNVIDQLCALL